VVGSEGKILVEPAVGIDISISYGQTTVVSGSEFIDAHLDRASDMITPPRLYGLGGKRCQRLQ
jgi:hypothetical protein